VDANGTPLFLQAAAANMSDHRQLLSIVAGFPRIAGRSGRPREMPSAVFADAGYDSDPARGILKLLKVTLSFAGGRLHMEADWEKCDGLWNDHSAGCSG
jgi:hypothetical protein